jgi:hypothetical protein
MRRASVAAGVLVEIRIINCQYNFHYMNGLGGNKYRVWMAKTERKRSLARPEHRVI